MANSKVAVVTGSNKGIGFAIVKALCQKFDGDVYLTARDEARGKEAVENLEAIGCHPKFHQLDVDNLDSIRRLRDDLKAEYGGLDVLVNNAGIAYSHSSTAPELEQAENTIRTNVFSMLNVCRELFPILRPHARVVNVSSSEGMLSHTGSKDLRKKFSSPNLTEEGLCDLMNQYIQAVKAGTRKQDGWASTHYRVSKIGVTALTLIQQRAFDTDSRADLVVNAVHPGYVKTDMTGNRGISSPDSGAEAPVYLALLPPNVKSPRGQMVMDDKSIATWKC